VCVPDDFLRYPEYFAKGIVSIGCMKSYEAEKINSPVWCVFIKTEVAGDTSSVQRTCTWSISMIGKIRLLVTGFLELARVVLSIKKN
jgi:hypothetical protein